MYVYIYILIHIDTNIHHIYLYICKHIYSNVTYIYTICTNTYIYIYTHLMCICIYIYICTNLYTYMFTLPKCYTIISHSQAQPYSLMSMVASKQFFSTRLKELNGPKGPESPKLTKTEGMWYRLWLKTLHTHPTTRKPLAIKP